MKIIKRKCVFVTLKLIKWESYPEIMSLILRSDAWNGLEIKGFHIKVWKKADWIADRFHAINYKISALR